MTLAKAFLRRDWLVARSYRLPFVMNLVASAFILVVIFQVGKLVGTSATAKEDGLAHGYFSFAVIGTLVIQVVLSASQTFSGKLREEQTTGTFEALLAAPASPGRVILGSGLYNVVQSLVMAVFVVCMALPLGLRVVLAPGWLVLSAVSFGAILAMAGELGILVAAFVVVFKQGSTLSGLIGTGLALLGGVWYPANSLPQGVRSIAQALPFTWGLTSLRGTLLFGHLDPRLFAGSLAAALLGLPISLWVFRASVDRARATGSLTQY